MTKMDEMILRTGLAERLCHWFLAACFLLTATSGLAWFFPSLSWLNGVLGTPQLARVLHPFLGIVVFVALGFMLLRFARHNLFARTDLLWFRKVGDVLRNRHGERLHIGKYNAGQKALFWLMMAAILVLLVSGLMMWRAYFAQYVPIPALRLAILAHSFAGIGLILLVVGHVYLALWVRGSIAGMVSGWVPRAWVRQHHDRWSEELEDEAHAAQARGRRA